MTNHMKQPAVSEFPEARCSRPRIIQTIKLMLMNAIPELKRWNPSQSPAKSSPDHQPTGTQPFPLWTSLSSARLSSPELARLKDPCTEESTSQQLTESSISRSPTNHGRRSRDKRKRRTCA